MLAVQVLLLASYCVDEFITEKPNVWLDRKNDVMLIIMMIVYSFMNYGISDSIKRTFNAQLKEKQQQQQQ
jgi:hypothetical protein